MIFFKGEFIARFLIYAYLILLIFTRLLTNISQYNAILYAFFCVIFFLLVKYNLFLRLKLFIIALIIFIFSYINNQSYLYICIDIAIVYFILSIFPLYDILRLDDKCIKLLNRLSLITLLLSVIMIWDSSNYINLGGEIRFIGFFKYGNLSASIVAILSILYWESFKILYKDRKRKFVLLLLLAFFLIYIYLSKTRSLLFFMPYLVYQYYIEYGRKIFFILSMFIITIVYFNIYEEIKILLRLKEDASFSTRENLSILLLEGIKENYYIYPHGSRKSTDFLEMFFNDTTLTPHNDFLRYLYDWGGAFIMLLFVIYYELRKRECINLNFILISLGYSSFALHNMLFLPYVFLPYLFILVVLKYNK